MISAAPMSSRPVTLAVALGVVLGLVYTLAPLSVLSIAALAAIIAWSVRAMGPRERRYFLWLVGAAIVLRVLMVAGLFLTADADRPFAVFFGDEELFKSRPVWIRNLGLGIPISAADFIYSYDDTGKSGYLFVLAYIQALVGDAPYSVHVLNAAAYLVAMIVMYRLVRARFGAAVAFAGLTVLLFLPSLFAWSISALKEPMYSLVAALQVLCVIQLVRAPRWWQKALAIAGMVAGAYALESLRKGGLQVAAIGAVAGIAGGLIIPRPKLLWPTLVVAPVLAVALLSVPRVQDRVLVTVRDAIRYHAGHVLTVGFTYHSVDPRYYDDWGAIPQIGGREATQYVVRAIGHFIVEPWPWTPRSTALLAYLPEQIVWWIILALVPVGVVAGLKLDALLTCTLMAHALAVMMMVALTSGNIGTLIRHRGLALPYIVWVAALGAYRVFDRLTRQGRTMESGMANGAR
jgi:hypothetical protein